MNQPNQKNTHFPDAKVAYIEACWHQNIVGQARIGFTNQVAKHGISEAHIDVVEVPGSLEIPLQAKLMAATGKYDVIVACGLIVDGGIYRHDFVATTVLDAMMRVSLDSSIPVLSVVLTPHHFQETDAHTDFFYAHFKKKGEEAANACVKTLHNMQELKGAH